MLPRPRRLHRARDIARVRRARSVVRGDLVTLRARSRRDNEPTRFGVIVSRRVSRKATERNTVLRRIRAFLTEVLPTVRDGYDVLIVAHGDHRDYTWERIRRDLAASLQRLRLVGS